MIGLLLKFTLFVLSMSGYCMLLNRKYSVYLEFTPILFCASISNVLFLAGILNLLPETVLGIWLCRLPAQTATCAIFGGHSVT